MTPLLEIPAIRDQLYRMSPDKYHRAGESGVFPEDVELLRGIVVTKVRKSPLHEAISQRLLELLFVRVPKGYTVRPERPLSLADSEPEPDLSVVKGKVGDWLAAHPSTAELVIEVAVTSVEIDKSKAEIYADAGIPEYWLIRAEAKSIEVFRAPSESGYRSRETVSGAASIQAVAVPGLVLTLAEIF